METKPEIIILCGIPTSGKSTLRNELMSKKIYIPISRDDVRYGGWGKNYRHSKGNEEIVTAICNGYFEESIKAKYNIIIDNTNCREKYLVDWIQRVPENYTYRVIFLDIPLWKAYYRNIMKWIDTGKWVPFKSINDMKRNYDKINRKKYQ